MLILINIQKFIFFIKSHSYVFFIKKTNSFNFNYFSIFLKYFFSKYYLKLIDKSNFLQVDNYLNNLIKGSIFKIFQLLNKFLINGNFQFKFNWFKSHYFFNSYFYSIKSTNFKINFRLSENLFFFFVAFTPFLWYQHSSFLKFYLNFILIISSFKMHKFFSGFFFKIYNY